MNKFIGPLVGLVYDDPWLFGGTLGAAVLALLAARLGLFAISGPVLALGVIAALWLSLRRV